MTVLRRKHEEVRAALDDMRDTARLLADEMSVKEAQLRNLEELLSIEGEPVQPELAEGNASGRHFLDEAERLMAEGGAGLHYRDILERLNRQGVHVPGQDPGANLIAHLTRDARFVRTGRGTYGLAGSHAERRPVRRRHRAANR